MNKIVYTFFIITLLSSCGKDFLDKKQNMSQVIPATISDLQALLDDNSSTINSQLCHELGLIGSDEYYLTDASWNGLPASAAPYLRRGYYWDKDVVYEGKQVPDWDYAYRKILYANTAYDGIEKIKPLPQDLMAWNNVKGSALFIRAFAFYQLAQEFCNPYDPQSSNGELGIPLRLKPDITAHVSRNSIRETYDQIVNDLKIAADLLPILPITKYRPSKAAAYALLAKTFLLMSDFKESGKYAELSLALKNQLIDFNTLNLNSTYCFPANMENNPEILYISYIPNLSIFATSRAKIDAELYKSYKDEDLGKKAYFTLNSDGTTYSFKGSYFGRLPTYFTGLAVDEVLLIKAESAARNGDLQTAADDINLLLKNRYDSKTFSPINFTSKVDAITEILSQRRKRLILRGVRWEDLRRLNQQPDHQFKIVRILNGIKHELLPNDLRYTWPIPDKAIEFGGYEQNPR